MSRDLASRASTLPAVADVRVLVTVGTELPFDRLVHAVDRWATASGVGGEVLAQVGETKSPPSTVAWTPFIDGPRFREYFLHADVVVSHAGMGTIISALREQRPLLVMPRRSALGEHRSDHQYATARRLAEQGRVRVALDEHELSRLLGDRPSTYGPRLGPHAEPGLLAAVRDELARITTPQRSGSPHVGQRRELSSRSHVS